MSDPSPARPQQANLESGLPLRTDLFWSLYGVWARHVRVYCQTFLANSLPPVVEPVFFFTALAFGLGKYLDDFGSMPYRDFIASGILVASAMFTGVYETTFGTFVRLMFQRTYDSMLGTHLRVSEMFIGEMLFTATKGAVFSTTVMLITAAFGVRLNAWCLLVPLLGFAVGYLFGAIGLIVTSYVKTINNFNFFLTGVITPMFFLSGTFFPIMGLNPVIDVLSQLIPLTHAVEVSRALFRGAFTSATLGHAVVLVFFIVASHLFAIHRMTRRVLR